LKIGGRLVRIRASDLESFIALHTSTPHESPSAPQQTMERPTETSPPTRNSRRAQT
jgi:hypothetical protein